MYVIFFFSSMSLVNFVKNDTFDSEKKVILHLKILLLFSRRVIVLNNKRKVFYKRYDAPMCRNITSQLLIKIKSFSII